MTDAVALAAAAALPPCGPAALEVRQDWRMTGLIGAVFAAIAAAALAAPFVAFTNEERPVAALVAGMWIGGWMGLMAKAYLRHARGALAADGWVLRADAEALRINLRSHLNSHYDPQAAAVLVVPRRRIRWLRVVDEHGRRAHVDEDGMLHQNPIRRHFLDVAFDGDGAAIKAAVAAEMGRSGPGILGSRSSYRHSAVRWLDDEGVLRIAWRDENNRLRPPLADVEAFLRRHFRFAEEVEGREAAIEALSRAEQEDRLTAMALRGDTMEAIKLARLLYGMDLTEAKRFVDELRGR